MSYVIFLADDFEDIEAVTLIDLLRRAKIDLKVYGVKSNKIKSRSNIIYQTEQIFIKEADVDVNYFKGILLPGGPGIANLTRNEDLLNIIRKFSAQDKLIFAICAAPLLLDQAGILNGKNYTCYPATPVRNGTYVEDDVVIDGNIITSRGVGTAIKASLKLIEIIVSKEEAYNQANKILFNYK